MKFSIVLISAAAFFLHQVAYGAETTPSEANTAPIESNFPLGEAELIESLGWGKQESEALSQFLGSINQLGELVHQEPQDESTTALLSEFQGHARELMAHAVFEYLQLANNPRVLDRLSTEEGLVMNFLDTLNRLLSKIRAPTAGKNKPLSDILGVFGSIKNAFENPFFPMNPAGDFNL